MSISVANCLEAVMEINGTQEADYLTGTNASDLIQGGQGRDIIDAGNGDDTLFGGLDGDILTGGMGSDDFLFKSFNERTDIITDFSVSEDRIILVQVFAQLEDQGNSPLIDQYLQFVQSGSSTRIQIDPDGLGTAPSRTIAIVLNSNASDLVVGGNVVI
ncbi:MAG: type I secretion C-terminal target domain-containing protein [Symploca sp. SIO1C4]|uniref:Type I secretion C-terminal target domain-containing protein n=1 Tax=Symploca sp. SIO1C4 TaxID=2607765 RepID=A0A6B3MYV6_9CYAN|nr:type I secretion C-terminal target domain-containing protein [Symploca sp. SIO1C4]